MDLGLKGRACVVTGASRGIGLATAQALVAEGASVLMVARSDSALSDAASSLGSDRAVALALDVTEADAGDRMVAECVERFGSIWALVNNAGTSSVRSLEDLSDAEWQAHRELHVMASLRAMRAAATWSAMPPSPIHSGEDTAPGATAFTSTPDVAYESANTRDSQSCAALVTE